MIRRLLLAAATALVVAAPAAAKGISQDVTLTMSDGVQVACTYWSPQGVEAIRVPGVMLFHGLGGKRQDMAGDAETLAFGGYAALACDARGHGQSGGLFGLDGLRDVQDTQELRDVLSGLGAHRHYGFEAPAPGEAVEIRNQVGGILHHHR